MADVTLSRYKACLVANGSTQLKGVDVDETFSLVVKLGTIRTILSLAASRHWPIHQLDVKNAFLHGDLSETIYMHQPSGFRDCVHPDYVCLLQRQGIDTAYLLLYVDDIVLTASSEGLFLSQKKYAAIKILEKAHMVSCKPSRTPVDTESKLGVDGDPVSDPTLYRSLAGSLKYLTFTRPCISYAVQQVCLHMHDPREPHFYALKRISRYVQGTLNYGLQLFYSSTKDLVAYSDADWAGYPTTRRLTSGNEAKYRGVANAVAETCWLRNLLRELHTPLSSDTLVYCDNVSAVYLSSNLVQHQRTKHIEIDIHFVRDLVAACQFSDAKRDESGDTDMYSFSDTTKFASDADANSVSDTKKFERWNSKVKSSVIMHNLMSRGSMQTSFICSIRYSNILKAFNVNKWVVSNFGPEPIILHLANHLASSQSSA
ncbi:ribonuclease H-like domain-containing protein [Tanacetum coccineum]